MFSFISSLVSVEIVQLFSFSGSMDIFTHNSYKFPGQSSICVKYDLPSQVRRVQDHSWPHREVKFTTALESIVHAIVSV